MKMRTIMQLKNRLEKMSKAKPNRNQIKMMVIKTLMRLQMIHHQKIIMKIFRLLKTFPKNNAKQYETSTGKKTDEAKKAKVI